MAGPGSDLSEELVWGCEPAALDLETFPRCPPGPVLEGAAPAHPSLRAGPAYQQTGVRSSHPVSAAPAVPPWELFR